LLASYATFAAPNGGTYRARMAPVIHTETARAWTQSRQQRGARVPSQTSLTNPLFGPQPGSLRHPAPVATPSSASG